MTREKCIEEMCKIMAFTYHSLGNYSQASDGFCSKCKEHQTEQWNFSNNGHVIEFIRDAIVFRLKDMGYKTPKGWNEDGTVKE